MKTLTAALKIAAGRFYLLPGLALALTLAVSGDGFAGSRLFGACVLFVTAAALLVEGHARVRLAR